ncbi:MFS transporter [Pseudonocardia sp. TRM90224]|uniref:MFS transporter n=1 Tax=Pseudonocardia sp. TRM90224 TaxID=2812678 RepID=UPI001E4EBC11|nr:MFS transporter [Pseudonocardia sp. TRM90224]
MSTTLDKSERLSGRALGVLLVLCGSIFLEGIDVSMMGVALPPIRAELGLSTSDLQWVVSAYVLGYGGFVLLGGRAADLLGRRRMFLLWLVVFIAFSGLGGLALNGWMLVVARFATGVAAGFMTPAGLSIITTMFEEGRARNRAVLIYAGTAAGGFTLGLVIGGLLTSFGWRWVFFAPVLLAAAILVAAVRLIPHEPRVERVRGAFDLPGAAALTVATTLLVLGIVHAPTVPVLVTVVTLAAGVAVLWAFVVIERRSSSPLVRLGILRSGALVRANIAAMLLVGAFIGFQFIVVLYLQEVRGWTPIATGLALLLAGLDAVLAPTLTPMLVNRFGNRVVAVAGLVLAAVAYLLILPLGMDWGYLAMLPTMIVLGTGFALAYGPLTIAATEGVAEEEQGLASGLLTTSFQFGSALGLAIVTAVVVAATRDTTHLAQVEAFRIGLLVPLGAVVIGAVVMATGLRRRAPVAAA